jgi:hypothetical protein
MASGAKQHFAANRILRGDSRFSHDQFDCKLPEYFFSAMNFPSNLIFLKCSNGIEATHFQGGHTMGFNDAGRLSEKSNRVPGFLSLAQAMAPLDEHMAPLDEHKARCYFSDLIAGL